jgi:3-hydroxy-9,10-secoandrosta-1,3,5(10)-triene-9,17-dione monooxygenase reductase component
VSFEDGTSRIGSDPFATPMAEREPARRLRGRLAAPVTVWTAYDAAGEPAGITVSSVLVAEGAPPEVLGLIDPLSAFWDAAREVGRFLVQILAADQRSIAERFALRVPGNPFGEVDLLPTPWGPAIDAASTRAGCAVTGSTDAGYAVLVRARIDEIVLDDRTVRPLVYYRGAYLRA